MPLPKNKQRKQLLAAALLTLALPLTAAACGVCIEDKVAATYDFEVIGKATKNDHQVLFFDIAGPLALAPQNRQAIADAVAKIQGVERGSVRVSLEPAAMSMVVDGKRIAAAEMQRRIEQKLAGQQLRLKLLKTIKNGTLSAPD